MFIVSPMVNTNKDKDRASKNLEPVESKDGRKTF